MPSSQLVQFTEPSISEEYSPGTHDEHTPAPGSEDCPSGQSRHSRWPVFGAYVFREQRMQLVASVSFEARPAGQRWQLPVGSVL